MISTSCTATESVYRNPSSLLWSYNKETSRSPCSTSSKEFVGFELEEATCSETEAVISADEGELEDNRRE
ncbi:hypothetical protein RB195_023938 [Necator americanus]|uniref:Ig-like domain-containing protein n=1 Tax=Necator americanus TaxID=51031 RepID=A0ABR1EL69_NECAM